MNNYHTIATPPKGGPEFVGAKMPDSFMNYRETTSGFSSHSSTLYGSQRSIGSSFEYQALPLQHLAMPLAPRYSNMESSAYETSVPIVSYRNVPRPIAPRPLRAYGETGANRSCYELYKPSVSARTSNTYYALADKV